MISMAGITCCCTCNVEVMNVLARLRKPEIQLLLLSFLLVNVQSLDNKLDELEQYGFLTEH